MSDAYQDIRVERRGEVDVVTIDRPEARNALTLDTYAELSRAVRETDARCLVVTGEDPAFCSGDDVKVVMKGGDGSVGADVARRPSLTDPTQSRRSPGCTISISASRPPVGSFTGSSRFVEIMYREKRSAAYSAIPSLIHLSRSPAESPRSGHHWWANSCARIIR